MSPLPNIAGIQPDGSMAFGHFDASKLTNQELFAIGADDSRRAYAVEELRRRGLWLELRSEVDRAWLEEDSDETGLDGLSAWS